MTRTLQIRRAAAKRELGVLKTDPSVDPSKKGRLEKYVERGMNASDADWKAVKSLISAIEHVARTPCRI